MGIILPGNGDSAGGQIIVPNGRRTEITGPTRKIPIHDNELLHHLRMSQMRGYLRHHRDHLHIVGCTDSGMFACLHCCKRVYNIESKEQQEHFLADHANCRAPTLGDAVGEIVVEV